MVEIISLMVGEEIFKQIVLMSKKFSDKFYQKKWV